MAEISGRPAVTGLILAGGLGRRLSADGNGTDKALTPYRGRPLIAHVIERLAPQVERLLINTHRDPAGYAAFGWPRVADLRDDRPGPLAGLQAGFLAADTPLVMVVPCDMPALPRDLVARLYDGLAGGGDAPPVDVAVAMADGREQPVCLLARRSLEPRITACLSAGVRRADAWYRDLPHRFVVFDDPAAFFNVNRLADLAR